MVRRILSVIHPILLFVVIGMTIFDQYVPKYVIVISIIILMVVGVICALPMIRADIEKRSL